MYAGNKSHIVITKDVKRIATIVEILSEATAEYEKQKSLEDKKAKTTKRKSENSSAADEIRKYKQLADEGIITIEEFNAKKKQLLGL